MYLQRRNGGIYYFRISVPSRLTAVYAKREITISLQTTNKVEAKLKSLEYIQKYLYEFSTGEYKNTITENKFTNINTSKNMLFSEVYSKYINERKPAPKSISSFSTAINRFIWVIGDKDISLYRKSDIVEFKNVLLNFPVYISEHDKSLSVEDVIEKYKSSRKISIKSINDSYLALVKTVFSYAVLNDYIHLNPAENVRVISHEQPEPKRLPFGMNQIEQMLMSDLFTKSQNEKFIEYRFIILLGLYTGSRLEELARSHIADVGEEDGIPFIFIRPHEDGHTVKTASARRRVPLHPNLMKVWGFAQFVAIGRRNGRKFVFPILNTNRQIRGSISSQFSKWFARWLSKIGLDDRRLCYHSYRHTLKAWGRSNGIEISILDVIQGHSIKSVSFNYGRDEYGSPYPLKVLYEAICKIDELNRLKPQK